MNTKRKQKKTDDKIDTQKTYDESYSKGSTLLDRSEFTLGLVKDWTIAADTKVSISSGVFSVMEAAIVFIAENILKDIDKSAGVNFCYFRWFIITAILAAVAFLVSEFMHLLAITPSLKAGNSKKGRNNKPVFSIFYDDIRQFENAEQYILATRNSSEKVFEDEVLKEVYINSQICTNKMNRFKLGIWIGFASIICTVICSILYYCSYTIH